MFRVNNKDFQNDFQRRCFSAFIVNFGQVTVMFMLFYAIKPVKIRSNSHILMWKVLSDLLKVNKIPQRDINAKVVPLDLRNFQPISHNNLPGQDVKLNVHKTFRKCPRVSSRRLMYVLCPNGTKYPYCWLWAFVLMVEI